MDDRCAIKGYNYKVAREMSKGQAAPRQVLRDAVKANKLLVSAAKEGWWKGVFQAPPEKSVSKEQESPGRHEECVCGTFQAIEHGAWLEIPDEADVVEDLPRMMQSSLSRFCSRKRRRLAGLQAMAVFKRFGSLYRPCAAIHEHTFAQRDFEMSVRNVGVKARASLNAREQCGWTPIHWAAEVSDFVGCEGPWCW